MDVSKNDEFYDLIISESQNDFYEGKLLFKEYAESLGFDLSFQNFEKELSEINIQYGPPSGFLLLIKTNNQYIGCVGIRKFNEDSAELKRMYIKPSYRGAGLGKMLLDKAIELTSSLNYKRVLLDTLSSMKPAIKIYEDYGFKKCKPYRFNPHEDVLYFEKVLE